ncbi:unnamed protein product [Fraxinus pennsylvanica]|uniref:Uncharacterized protein n=1 Tax=Fraxinus pennsylvanica TaxID=56036 RepID=A0AAD1ZBQ0_9LAMI|nr:unnamed protein product [Fraxinus pennsylvanica]
MTYKRPHLKSGGRGPRGISEPEPAKCPYDQETSAFAANSPSNISVNLASVKCSANMTSSASLSPSLLETLVKNINSSSEMSTTQRTPAELVYSLAELMSATPVLRTPKRRYMSPNDDSFRSPSKLVQRSPRSKSHMVSWRNHTVCTTTICTSEE